MCSLWNFFERQWWQGLSDWHRLGRKGPVDFAVLKVLGSPHLHFAMSHGCAWSGWRIQRPKSYCGRRAQSFLNYIHGFSCCSSLRSIDHILSSCGLVDICPPWHKLGVFPNWCRPKTHEFSRWHRHRELLRLFWRSPHLFLGKGSDKISLLGMAYRSTLICWLSLTCWVSWWPQRHSHCIGLDVGLAKCCQLKSLGSMHKNSNFRAKWLRLYYLHRTILKWQFLKWEPSLKVQKVAKASVWCSVGLKVNPLHCQDSTSATTCVWTFCGSTCATLTGHER